jgi:hypothetical protein
VTPAAMAAVTPAAKLFELQQEATLCATWNQAGQ